jgi:hypothetical protein
MNWKSTTPATVLPRSSGGVDYGAKRILIAQRGDALVYWQKGSTAWSGVGYREYSPGALVLATKSQNFGPGKRIAEGGRLSAALLTKHHAAIAHHLGVAPVDLPLMRKDKTLMWVEGTP